MTSQAPPPSGLPPSMGPGARPVQPGEHAGRPSRLAEIIKARSTYTVAAESEVLQLGYEMNGKSRLYRLPFESLPLGSFSRWLLYGGPKRARTTGSQVLDSFRTMEEDLGNQPITQREAEGLTYWISKACLYRVTGDVVACSLGGIVAYRNREKMKFPFISPKPLERYNSFPSSYLPLVQGRYAQILWHITRANMYAGLFIIGLSPIFRYVGSFAATSGIYLDDRTRRLVEAVQNRVQRSADRARLPGGPPNGVNAQRQSPGSQAQSDNQYSASPQQADDGNRGAAATYDYADGPQYEGGLAANSDWRSQESGQWSSSPSYATPSAPEQPGQPGGDDLFFDDDASPTVGNGTDLSSDMPYNRARGSAWARIRAGDRPTSPQAGGPPASELGQQPGASEEFPSKGGWRSRETLQRVPGQPVEKMSQREFDEMLERERRLSLSEEYSKGMRVMESGQDDTAKPNSGTSTSAWERRRNW
ncbi:hypothetical protein A1O1_02703 [Capronia coronata CBS 617.96]|uniref:Uncharacterized protein n=1 Tax=Capronia coronata CBS 617.96 TaxID=1182541 RepID=W9ZII1_9EURO|nr:uncharacterized protein A1O1_02703 [Capronia coronata CBS 617.96]EXJ94309.1 hypothetical protein A1O1_02703 [Capronia coronata CBS 617.96]